ncbi:protein TolQ [Acidihalobacter ferrooxydans]|uniref:Tol-Pal system protein TolQ n=1 Tax=Acidihalobacter ferrooxydans TaxID=1765967 RepID=A0A1P8UHT7_9GAMM|nr:protein TolQ [Acidihalobacter ferrooxydans]APZ43379.1 protein TolQ [Acidihalobacter ferrooxydans]
MSVEPSFFQLVIGASLVVQVVILILLLASILSWTAIFIKWGMLRRARRAATQFEDRFWSGSNLSQIYEGIRAKSSRAGLEAIFSSGFREYLRLHKPGQDVVSSSLIDTAQRSMRVALSREEEKLERSLSFLATVGSVSPYIGLFGTVWGIMHAFMALGNVQQASLAMVAPGIAEALVATAMGLFAAIPAVVAYNRYADEVERLITRYENFQDEFLALLQRQLATVKAEV